MEVKNLIKNYPNITEKENLSKYSWFGLGGPAEFFFRPHSLSQLASFLKEVSKKGKKVNIIGAGSNTLIRDGGVSGITIKLGSKFAFTNLIEENVIHVGAATLDKKISDFALANSLSNFEFLSCIPGSIGGGIIMNSGCYGDEISKILISIEVMDMEGHIREIKKNDIKFFYRGCDLGNNQIILSAKFLGLKANRIDIEKKQNSLIERKKNSQPSQVKTCGSTFKNPPNQKAWELIKQSNCENMFVGQAKISTKHCNFFVNEGKATSIEIEQLINKIQKQVLENTGTKLELEIKIIGNDLK